MLHVANFLTDSIAGHQLGSYLAQLYNCVAAHECCALTTWLLGTFPIGFRDRYEETSCFEIT